MNPDAILKLCSEVLGDGFDVPKDREGWFFECSECSATKDGQGGSHKEDCKRGAAVRALDEYLESHK